VLTPERAVEIQCLLGSDIHMQLDECLALPASRKELEGAVARSLAWAVRAERALRVELEKGTARQATALFGIVQGGTDPELRARSAEALTAMDLPGYAVGGLAVGEPRDIMLETFLLTARRLPADKPRYLMGVGTPSDLIAAIAMGFDMFDCVLPTRNARNGMAFTSAGPVSIKQAAHARDSTPLDPACDCRPCQTHSRAYLRHLYLSGEILAARALTEHNLHFFASLMRQSRDAISSGSFRAFANVCSGEMNAGDRVFDQS
jgi:queuine tRNA-ribosyltransferase